jgi:hypothetical protein
MNFHPALETEQTTGVTDPGVEVAAIFVEFLTGTRRAAGTDADVFLRIGAQTFPMPVEHGRDPFEKGATDRFSFPLDPPMKLGAFRQAEMEVFHNSAGLAPGWFVDAIRLYVGLSGPGQSASPRLYKEWKDIGWLAIDEAPKSTQVLLQQGG